MAGAEEKTQYRAGTGRRLVFAFVFLLLLPFYISLGPMLFWRISQGHWLGTFGLLIIAVLFSILMFLILIELIFSIRSEVRFGEKTVELTLPSGRGATPMLRYAKQVVPFADVDSVEIRREVYRNRLAPVTMKGARVKMKDGRFIKLGYVNEANVDACMPYPEIGEQIAARARVPLVDSGYVLRSARDKIFGRRAEGEALDPIEENEVAKINRKHQNFMIGLVGALVLLVGLGMASDRDRRIDVGSLFELLPSQETPE